MRASRQIGFGGMEAPASPPPAWCKGTRFSKHVKRYTYQSSILPTVLSLERKSANCSCLTVRVFPSVLSLGKTEIQITLYYSGGREGGTDGHRTDSLTRAQLCRMEIPMSLRCHFCAQGLQIGVGKWDIQGVSQAQVLLGPVSCLLMTAGARMPRKPVNSL